MDSEEFNLDEIPQANDLSKVGLVAISVSKGCKTYQDIANFLGVSERQGRYYRKAAEILGLIYLSGRNKSQLTKDGELFVKDFNLNKDLIKLAKSRLSSVPIIREVYEIVSDKSNVNETDILNALFDVSGLDSKNQTIIRRLSTFINWLKQAELLIPTSDKNKEFNLIPLIPKISTVTKLSDIEKNFVEGLLPYLSVDKVVSNTDWEERITEYKNLQNQTEKNHWLEYDEENSKLARYIIGISSSEAISLDILDQQLGKFLKIELNHSRLLVERDRSMKFVSKSISSGGDALEDLIERWLNDYSIEFFKAHLLEGSEKNVDFFVPSLNLAIECKYSKTSGTKHGGALSDLSEISKSKKFHPHLLVGVAIAGNGFDDAFFENLTKLHQDSKLDFAIPALKFNAISPSNIRRENSIAKPNDLDLLLEYSFAMSWHKPFSAFENGLYDSTFWLEKYSSVPYLSLEHKLQNWLNQTPFALNCLRLILGWSETQLDNYILNIVPDARRALNDGKIKYDHILEIVNNLSKNLKEEELTQIERFFQNDISLNDFVNARIEAFDGIARKKKNTSQTFVNLCKERSAFPVTESRTNLTLDNNSKLQSNFSITLPDKSKKNVLCKFYATDGSVMSDLAKKIESLAGTPEEKNWIFIIDGPGWKKRSKDLRRILSISHKNGLHVYNLSDWSLAIESDMLKAQ